MPELRPTPGEEHIDMPGAPEPADADVPDRAEKAERQRDEYLSLLRQAQADYENAHQRHRREREQEHKYRAEPLARDLLPAIDNLERALATARESGDTSPLSQGVSLVRDQILESLKRHGVVPMNVVGKPFDPHHHQAMMQLPDAEKPSNTVLQVLEQGYMIHDRVLRAAKVIISALPTE